MEQVNDRQEASAQFSGKRLAAELNKMTEQSNLKKLETAEKAWQKYVGYGEEYQQANAERVSKREVAVLRYPEATLIASIRLNPATGEAISGHDYDPDAKSHLDTEAEFEKYVQSIPPEQRFVIYEGSDANFSTRDEAIRGRADAGLNILLADKAGIERTTGEPSDLEVAAELERRGVSREEAALYTTLRSLGTKLVQRPDYRVDPGGDIYFQLARNGVPGFREYSEEEKAQISQQPAVRDELLRQMAAQGTQFALERFNPMLRQLQLPEFEVGVDGKLSLGGIDGTKLVEMAGPFGEGRLTEIARMTSEYRDNHLFKTIVNAVKAGKHPFVVYGGSHIVALRPVLDAYFNAPKPQSSQAA
jgi:hypothetical protein